MASRSPAALAHGDDRDAVRDNRDVDHNFLPDFAFAAVGGVAALAACVLILMLTTSFSGGHRSPHTPASLPAHSWRASSSSWSPGASARERGEVGARHIDPAGTGSHHGVPGRWLRCSDCSVDPRPGP